MIRNMIKDIGVARFSEVSGIDITYLSRYVNGKRSLTVTNVAQIIRSLNKITGRDVRELSKLAAMEIVEDIGETYRPNTDVLVADEFINLNKRRFLDPVGKNPIVLTMYEDFLRTDLKWLDVKREIPGLVGLFRGKSSVPTWRTMIKAARLFKRPDTHYVEFYILKEVGGLE